MSSLPQRRTRSERVALRSSSKAPVARFVEELRRDNQGLFFVFMLLMVVAMGAVMQVWNPPFTFRLNTIPYRSIVCHTPFAVESPDGRERAEERMRWETPHFYVNDPQPLVQIRESLWNIIAALVHFPDYHQLDAKGQEMWRDFLRPSMMERSLSTDVAEVFADFHEYFKNDPKLDRFNALLKRVFTPLEVHGILTELDFGPTEGNQERIMVYLYGESPDKAVAVKVSDVLIRDGIRLLDVLQWEMLSEPVARRVFQWIRSQLREDTLKKDEKATKAAIQEAIASVGVVMMEFIPGQTLVEMGTPLGQRELALLQAEYRESLKKRTLQQQGVRFAVISLMMSFLFIVCWGFVQRRERRRPQSTKAVLAVLLGMFLTVAVAKSLDVYSQAISNWEILPLLIFVQLISLVYSWELAIVFSTSLILFLAIGLGFGNGTLLILLGTTVSVALQLGRLRIRHKLFIVSLLSGFVAFLLTFSVGILDGELADKPLLVAAALNFVWTILAGIVMTALLPFVEEIFDVLTDMSLLELGNVSQPLLQSLVRLAPATYGHSIAVGTIAETAAEAIGARSLITRVGAYYHDIGKIMKPEYYSENQGGINNIHDHLEPQVSTIVLVAHVKDGVDLARQHRLPQPIIDLVEQHHGTSLVSFFYGKAATKASKDESLSGIHQVVEESTYRYPGPKPRSKEAAILMIADTCESACRSMRENATPNRVENKVRALIKQKLDDGQLDDCGLTLHELKTIENSVITSVIALLHGRIKYPGQEAEEAAPIKGETSILLDATVTKPS
jgi:putative nucleotidyltransferase with HDIG domain